MRPGGCSAAAWALLLLAAGLALGASPAGAQAPEAGCAPEGEGRWACRWDAAPGPAELAGAWAFAAPLPAGLGTTHVVLAVRHDGAGAYCWGLYDATAGAHVLYVLQLPGDPPGPHRALWALDPARAYELRLDQCHPTLAGQGAAAPRAFTLEASLVEARGSTPAGGRAGGPDDPQLLDDLGDGDGSPHADLGGAWLDDPVLDDGLLEVGLLVPRLARIHEAPSAETMRSYYHQAVAYHLRWSHLGEHYGVAWSYHNEKRSLQDGAAVVDAAVGYVDVRWSARLYRVVPLNTALGVATEVLEGSDELLAHLPLRVDEANGTLRATVPLDLVGDPGAGAPFEGLFAYVVEYPGLARTDLAEPLHTFVARYAVPLQPLQGHMNQTNDVADTRARPFALGGPEVWEPLAGRPPPSATAPQGAPPPPAAPPGGLPWQPLGLAGLGLAAVGLAAVAATRRRRRPLPVHATPGPSGATPASPTQVPSPALAAPPAVEAPVPGATFLGKYDVVRELGRGAFGATWLATHAALGRAVVVKQLHPEWSLVPEARARFEGEARILAALDHPRVTRIYDIEHVGHAWYLVMEYVDGGSLEDRLARGPLPPEEAARVTAHVLEGLAYIHARGVHHRDLKPSNILLTQQGDAKLADFGVARSRDVRATRITQASSPIGTPLYMAPEQVRGEPGDARSDLYAVAVTFHRLVSGQFYLQPRPRDAFELRRAIVEQPPALPIEGLAPELEAWLRRSLAKDPAARFPTAEAMAAALAEALGAPGPPPGAERSRDERTRGA